MYKRQAANRSRRSYQDFLRRFCVTMQSQIKTDKYNDVRTLLDDAFARYTGYTEIPAPVSYTHLGCQTCRDMVLYLSAKGRRKE